MYVVRLMDDSRALSSEETSILHLVDAAFQYITESKYLVKCTEAMKRAIRKKAAMFIVRDGVMFSKKRKKGRQVSVRLYKIEYKIVQFYIH